MRNVPALLRRELNAYFASVLGYIVILFFLLVMGVSFVSIIGELLARGSTQMTVMEGFFSWFWLPSLFLVPAITMRLLAEEKRAGTLEMLMTAPVTDFEVVLAKWLGAVALYTLMWAATGLYVVIGQFLIAVGLVASAMTRNQVTAFLIAFALLFLYLIAIWFGYYFTRGTTLGKVFEFLSAFEQMNDFQRGVVDLRPLVLYASGTVLALFVTTRVVESRKWR
jgi:ABC-2 type transport system permease protein